MNNQWTVSPVTPAQLWVQLMRSGTRWNVFPTVGDIQHVHVGLRFFFQEVWFIVALWSWLWSLSFAFGRCVYSSWEGGRTGDQEPCSGRVCVRRETNQCWGEQRISIFSLYPIMKWDVRLCTCATAFLSVIAWMLETDQCWGEQRKHTVRMVHHLSFWNE